MEEAVEQKMDYDDFAGLFGMWAPRFKPFIESKAMWDIYQRLKADSKKERIVPNPDNTFKAFSTTVPEKIVSIWYLLDPYPRLYKDRTEQATGIAMDCSNSPEGKLQPSLEKFYDAMSKELKEKVEYSPDLKYLHDQGVMLLNTELTVKLNKTGSHSGLWEPFQKYFLEEIMGGFTGIIYVLAGKESKKMKKFINPLGNYIFEIDHPASAAHNRTDWDPKGVFKMTNRILKENDGMEIFWNKADFDTHNDPPF